MQCGAYAKQYWSQISYTLHSSFVGTPDLKACICTHCKKMSVWRNGKLIDPVTGGVAFPNPDLPADVIEDYIEASNILDRSPRGAAALLRLAIQKLCVSLGERGKNINDDIASLVQKGLPKRIQQSLDIVRVIGNNAVHPGTIDLKDDRDTSSKLFVLVNIIAEVMITQPKEIDELFNSLPEGQRVAIEKRDGAAE
jgi:hypothetical protein